MGDVVLRVGAIVRRDALLALRQPLGLITRWFSSLVAIVGFYFVARLVDPHRTLSIDGRHEGYFSYVSVNLSFMLLQTSALGAMAATIRTDQLMGTLEPIFATRAHAGVYVASCGVWPLILSVAQVVFSLGIATAFLGLDLQATSVPSLLAFVVLSTLAMSAFGVLSAAGVVAFKQVPPSGFLVGGAASLLAGTLFPTNLFPHALQWLSWCLPLTHALRGLRGAVLGDSIAALAGDAIWLAVAVLVLLPASFLTLHYAVERARRDGTLAQY